MMTETESWWGRSARLVRVIWNVLRARVRRPRYKGRTLIGERIVLDYATIQDCELIECGVVYYGIGPVTIVRSTMNGGRVVFRGPAGSTLAFLQAMEASGGESLIRNTFSTLANPPEPWK